MRKIVVLLLVSIGLMSIGFGLYWQAISRATSYRNDDLRRAIVPQRIVTLSPNLTEIVFALGLGDKVVAVSSNCDWPAEAKTRKKVGTFWQPDTEAIIASKPDLVIINLSTAPQEAVAESLERLGYRVLSLRMGKIEELSAAIQKIGAATDCEQRADQLADDINGQLNLMKSEYSSTKKPRVLWVVQAEPLRVAGRNTFVNEIVELAGGENAIGPTIAQYPHINTEELLTCNVEVIIQSAMGNSDIDQQQRQAKVFWSKWAGLPAVKNNKIYVVNSDIVLRLGPRLPQGVEMVGRCLYPDTSVISNETTQQTR